MAAAMTQSKATMERIFPAIGTLLNFIDESPESHGGASAWRERDEIPCIAPLRRMMHGLHMPIRLICTRLFMNSRRLGGFFAELFYIHRGDVMLTAGFFRPMQWLDRPGGSDFTA
ncbi:hypothetical protein [Azospirillum sp. A39]|uniref:hypothetical protein n=1 Tax=Azospirillum sp. A39 TaxID=3462279 RepID=UPI004045406A